MKYFIYLLLAFLFVSSCQKDPIAPEDSSSLCLIDTVFYENSLPQSSYEYFTDGTVKSIRTYDNTGTEDEFFDFIRNVNNGGMIIYGFENYIDTNVYTLNSNNLIDMAVGVSHSSTSNSIDTSYFYYDSENFQYKSEEISLISPLNGSPYIKYRKDSSVIENENIRKTFTITTANNIKDSSIVEYTYSDTLRNEGYSSDFFPNFPLYGKQSINFKKTATKNTYRTDNSGTYLSSTMSILYNYELENGRVRKIYTNVVNGGTYIRRVHYTCD